ncbi:hypothetical protein PGTUg99_026574 [Puccinia graminis f. sp. tritici]|nr:hypothetical protein PGTUg99_026574 [Puccinia graminis f. sp. tritici]
MDLNQRAVPIHPARLRLFDLNASPPSSSSHSQVCDSSISPEVTSTLQPSSSLVTLNPSLNSLNVNVQATPLTPKELRSGKDKFKLLTTHQTGSGDVAGAYGLGEHEENRHLEPSDWNQASQSGDTEDLKKPDSSPSSQNLQNSIKGTTSWAGLKGEPSTKRRKTSFDSPLDFNDRSGENSNSQRLK